MTFLSSIEICGMPEAIEYPGYIELLAKNPHFRKFWVAQQVSLAGDWISVVALYGLVLSLTGSPLDISLMLVCSLTPHILLEPFGGVLADRYNRKIIMVASDFIRTFLVLGFLFIHHPSEIGIIYLIIVMTEILGALHYPASESAFPNLVESGELYTANALAGASWGTMLAVGSAVGGGVSMLFGRNACFVLDAASFLLSGLITLTVTRPFSAPRPPSSTGGWHDLKEGIRYAAANGRVWQVLLFYGGLGFATGAVILYSIFPAKIFHDGDFGIGVLYSLRGFGALAGPLLVRRLVGEDLRSIWRGLIQACVLVGIFYLALSRAPGLAWAGVAVFGAHVGNGAFWLLSSIFFQKHVPDKFLGRISSLQISLFTLTMTLSSLACGVLTERISPRGVAVIFGIAVIAFSAFWGWFTRENFPRDLQ